LAAYETENMHPKDRWEQEQIEEFEGFVVLEQLQLIYDEVEQLHDIDQTRNWFKIQKDTQNNEELIRHEQWEQLQLLHEQIKQDTNSYI
jgi:hypothetical protein